MSALRRRDAAQQRDDEIKPREHIQVPQVIVSAQQLRDEHAHLGVCKVCGFSPQRQTTRSDAGIISSVPMPIVFGASLGLIAVLIAADSIKRGKRR